MGTIFMARAVTKETQTLRLEVEKLSQKEMKELLVLTMYKLAVTRSQLDAVTDVLVKKRLTTRADLWKQTDEHFSDTGF